MPVDGVVICAGVASRKFAAVLGDRVNIYPVKGYSITVDLQGEEPQRRALTVSLLDDETKIVSSRLGRDRFRVAGTAEFNGENRDIRADRVKPLVDWTRELFPGVATTARSSLGGPAPDDARTCCRASAAASGRASIYNTGHGHLGWTLSAATAPIVAQSIAGDHVPDAASRAVARRAA